MQQFGFVHWWREVGVAPYRARMDENQSNIDAGVQAAIAWPAFAADSMAMQFDCVRELFTQSPMPAASGPGGGSMWDAVSGLVPAVEAQASAINRALTARVVANAEAFGVPVPADVAEIAERLNQTGEAT